MPGKYQAGLRVGEYILEEWLGRGAFAEVWRARHCVWSDQRVAVKLAIEPDYIHYLRNEGRIVHELRHPNIVTVLGFDPWAEPPYLALEWVQGPALEQVLREHAQHGLPVAAVLAIFRGVLYALIEAHAKQVVHCDLKPGNILLHLAGQPLSALSVAAVPPAAVKVSDFGLARSQMDQLRSLAQSASLDRRDKLVGTLAYMAPEVRDGRKPDARADLFSLGVILFEMLTGERPSGMDPPSRYRNDLPAWMDAFVARLCARHEWRYASAAAILRDLATQTPPVRESFSAPSAAPQAREKISAKNGSEKGFTPSSTNKRAARRIPPRKQSSSWRWRVSFFGAMVLALWVVGKIDRPGAPATKPADLALTLDGGTKLELMRIPAGEFFDETGRLVKISRPFYLGKYEVTQAQWKALLGNNPSRFQGEDDLPVDSVSWNECQEFCRRLAEKTGRTVRLPTEAEWEYACRAGTRTPYHFGATISTNRASYDGYHRSKHWQRTLPVGGFAANAWGLHDMHGNVWEWCQDWYDRNAQRGHSTLELDPTGPKGGTGRMLCGGSWVSVAENCRAGARAGHSPDGRLDVVGFRIVVAGP